MKLGHNNLTTVGEQYGMRWSLFLRIIREKQREMLEDLAELLPFYKDASGWHPYSSPTQASMRRPDLHWLELWFREEWPYLQGLPGAPTRSEERLADAVLEWQAKWHLEGPSPFERVLWLLQHWQDTRPEVLQELPIPEDHNSCEVLFLRLPGVEFDGHQSIDQIAKEIKDRLKQEVFASGKYQTEREKRVLDLHLHGLFLRKVRQLDIESVASNLLSDAPPDIDDYNDPRINIDAAALKLGIRRLEKDLFWNINYPSS